MLFRSNTILAERKLERIQAISTKLKDADRERSSAKKEMADLDSQGLLTITARAELTNKIAKAEDRIYELNLLQNKLIKEKGQLRQSAADIDVERPTLEGLAGRDFVRKLNQAYGPGGMFDLEAGNGPFASDAQQALLWKKREQWDINNGNAQWTFNNDTNQMMLTGGDAYLDKLDRERF